MAFVPATNTAEVVVNGNYGGQDVASVHNFEFPDALTTTILSDLAASVIASWITNLAPLMMNLYNLISVKATDLSTSSSPSVTRFPGGTTQGSLSGTGWSNNTALVLSEGTDLRGRSFRGRCYHLAGPNAQLIDTASVSSTYRNDMVAGFVSFFDDIESDNDCVHVVVSRFTGGSPRMSAVMTPVGTYSANQDLDSQRRRLKGRGS